MDRNTKRAAGDRGAKTVEQVCSRHSHHSRRLDLRPIELVRSEAERRREPATGHSQIREYLPIAGEENHGVNAFRADPPHLFAGVGGVVDNMSTQPNHVETRPRMFTACGYDAEKDDSTTGAV